MEKGSGASDTNLNIKNIFNGLTSFRILQRLYRIHFLRSRTKNSLLGRPVLDGKFLLLFYYYIDKKARKPLDMNLSAQWLIENRELLVTEIQDVQNNLNRKFLSLLPKGDDGMPRVYQVVLDSLREEDFVFKEKRFTERIQKYQHRNVLELDEIAAIPFFLKYILLEEVCDLAWLILQDTRARKDVLKFLNKKAAREYSPESIQETFETIEREGAEYCVYFFYHLKKSLNRTQEAEQILSKGGKYMYASNEPVWTCLEVLHKDQVGVCITSVIKLKEFDTDVFFKNVSFVDKVLSKDPVDVYTHMDAPSKSSYLAEIRKISRNTKIPELKIAQTILTLAINGTQDFSCHVGYYLIDKGRSKLGKELNARLSRLDFNTKSFPFYLSGIIILGFLIFFFIMKVFNIPGNSLLFVSFLLIIPAYTFSKKIIDTFISNFIHIRRLPRMKMKEDLDEENATIFSIPCFLTDESDIKRLLWTLERIYLGNQGKNIFFSLVIDYKDSDKEKEAGEELLLQSLEDEIKELNVRYKSKDKFSFFIRSRVWSENQNRWMGWERKRGKVLEFMNFLRGNQIKSSYYFSLPKIPKVKYFITVDEDTAVPKDFIPDLVAALSHVLNKPVFDNEKGKLQRGYTIIQPRLDSSYKTKNQTVLSRQLCDVQGFNYYSRLSAELYYDLFADANYTGKGIVEIDAFLQLLNGRFPDDSLLSHDLVEGAIAGTAYASDSVIYEGFSSTIKSHFMRLHRWTRGDWQIVDWLGNRVKDQNGEKRRNPMTLFQKFKILDNLSRSLFPSFLFLSFVFSLFSIKNLQLIVSVLFSLEFFFLDFSLGIYSIFKRNFRRFRPRYIPTDVKYVFINTYRKKTFNFLFLPYEAILSLDAVVKALWRRYVTHKNTLEWTTFIDSEKERKSPKRWYMKAFSLPYAFLTFLLIASYWYLKPIPFLIVVIVIWLLIPVWVFLYDRKIKSNVYYMKDKEPFLRKVAWRTWNYFDTYTNESTNFLPPDNIQGIGGFQPAKYTSITNVGFYLTSIFSAFDLKYISYTQFLRKVDQILRTLNQMERFNGHYYNWYDLATLRTSKPYFVSTVDSGNFLACILVLAESIKKAPSLLKFDASLFHGLNDIINEILDLEPNLATDIQLKLVQLKDNQKVPVKSVDSALAALSILSVKVDELQALPAESYPYFSQLRKNLLALKNSLIADILEVYPVIEKEVLRKINNKKVLAAITLVKNSGDLKELNKNLEQLDFSLKDQISDAAMTIANITSQKRTNIVRINHLAEMLLSEIDSIISLMDFSFLYDKKKKLVSIGYKAYQKKLEKYHYPILATEPRLAIFLAIAKNEVPIKVWKQLKRKVHQGKKGPFLMSWSGTMFEYFMPSIFMKYYPESIYHQTFDSFLAEEKDYSAKFNIPWGISESYYGITNKQGKYKYKAFGIEAGALRPDADTRHIISPYSSFLSMTHDFKGSIANLERLEKEGGLGEFGFYESVDYSNKNSKQVVSAYMSHHQGMILNSITNVLSSNILVKLFHSNKMVQAVEYLLEENRSGPAQPAHAVLKNAKNIRYKND